MVILQFRSHHAILYTNNPANTAPIIAIWVGAFMAAPLVVVGLAAVDCDGDAPAEVAPPDALVAVVLETWTPGKSSPRHREGKPAAYCDWSAVGHFLMHLIMGLVSVKLAQVHSASALPVSLPLHIEITGWSVSQAVTHWLFAAQADGVTARKVAAPRRKVVARILCGVEECIEGLIVYIWLAR